MQNLNLYFLFILLTLFLSCNKRLPEDVKRSLELAGENRYNLINVIDHYQSTEDTLKLKAAYYLIGNMPGFSYIDDPNYIYFNNDLFSILDSLWQLEKNGKINMFYFRKAFDSLQNKHLQKNLSKSFDLNTIKSEMLIDNIESAFEVWDLPWSKHLNFNEFCEYVLPYRSHYEPLEDYREILKNNYIWLLDSMNDNNDPIVASKFIDQELKTWFRFSETFWKYPGQINCSNYFKGKMGKCNDQVNLAIYVMRSLGIPITLDIVPQWANRSMSHPWNVVLDKNRDFKPFQSGYTSFEDFYLSNKAPKIYRRTFKINYDALLFKKGK